MTRWIRAGRRRRAAGAPRSARGGGSAPSPSRYGSGCRSRTPPPAAEARLAGAAGPAQAADRRRCDPGRGGRHVLSPGTTGGHHRASVYVLRPGPARRRALTRTRRLSGWSRPGGVAARARPAGDHVIMRRPRPDPSLLLTSHHRERPVSLVPRLRDWPSLAVWQSHSGPPGRRPAAGARLRDSWHWQPGRSGRRLVGAAADGPALNDSRPHWQAAGIPSSS